MCSLQKQLLLFCICSGHGVCDYGILGSGICIFEFKILVREDSKLLVLYFSFMRWSGDDCSKCESGYYGPLCKLQCQYTIEKGAKLTCSNHGSCMDGVLGTGHCICDSSYFGSSCSQQCPLANGLVCNGVGVCDDGAEGTGVCNCIALGMYFQGDSCNECVEGWVGSKCSISCPRSLSGDICTLISYFWNL